MYTVFLQLAFLIFTVMISSIYAACPNGWEEFDERCYLFLYKEPKKWIDAQSYCHLFGGMLAEPKDMLNDMWMAKRAQQISVGTWWIGIADVEVEGTWRWADNRLKLDKTHTNWKPGHPINDETHNCAATQEDTTWASDRCNHQLRFICEKPLYRKPMGHKKRQKGKGRKINNRKGQLRRTASRLLDTVMVPGNVQEGKQLVQLLNSLLRQASKRLSTIDQSPIQSGRPSSSFQDSVLRQGGHQPISFLESVPLRNGQLSTSSQNLVPLQVDRSSTSFLDSVPLQADRPSTSFLDSVPLQADRPSTSFLDSMPLQSERPLSSFVDVLSPGNGRPPSSVGDGLGGGGLGVGIPSSLLSGLLSNPSNFNSHTRSSQLLGTNLIQNQYLQGNTRGQ